MKVLLKEDVDHLGYAGDVYEVAMGYGRNYLLPRGLAVPASVNALKQAEQWRERATARREEQRAEYSALAARIDGLVLTFDAKASDKGKLFGSVTTNEVADLLNETLGTELDRRKVVGDPLRQLGEHTITVRLSGEFQPTVTVNVKDSTQEVEEKVVETVEEVVEAVDGSEWEDVDIDEFDEYEA
jgi:large subunit ribosomal protein L9